MHKVQPAPENPELKQAAAEIKAVLEKYNCAGVVILQVPSHTEFLLKVDPPHSLGYLEGRVFRVKDPTKLLPKGVFASDEELDVATKKLRTSMAANTINMLANLARVGNMVVGQLHGAYGYAAQHLREYVQPAVPPQSNGRMPDP